MVNQWCNFANKTWSSVGILLDSEKRCATCHLANQWSDFVNESVRHRFSSLCDESNVIQNNHILGHIIFHHRSLVGAVGSASVS